MGDACRKWHQKLHRWHVAWQIVASAKCGIIASKNGFMKAIFGSIGEQCTSASLPIYHTLLCLSVGILLFLEREREDKERKKEEEEEVEEEESLHPFHRRINRVALTFWWGYSSRTFHMFPVGLTPMSCRTYRLQIIWFIEAAFPHRYNVI